MAKQHHCRLCGKNDHNERTCKLPAAKVVAALEAKLAMKAVARKPGRKTARASAGHKAKARKRYTPVSSAPRRKAARRLPARTLQSRSLLTTVASDPVAAYEKLCEAGYVVPMVKWPGWHCKTLGPPSLD